MVNRRRQYIAHDASLGNLPLRLYNMGLIQQKKIIRLEGFPVLHLFINRSGGGQFQTLNDGREWTLADHQACILPARVPHTYYPHPDTVWKLGFVTITGPAVNDLLETMNLPPMETIPLKSTETIWTLFERIFQLVRENPPEQDWSISSLLYELLLEVLKQSAHHLEASAASKNSAGAIKLAAKMIREHYAEPILLAEYADSLGYTVQHLNRLFKQAYGVTMHQYLDDIRFEKSLQLLGLDMSVQDIASALGMEANYFIRAFKRVHGITPGQYKKSL
ncbi:helix-turn-helix transcriptional regulator [Paenibacillus hemerocallicola]|uniref:Helix-turn-helix transcriptional regulator n=1 Tax=Paenibacillus hemerocallicola TaxID=1172614 RepID=A0A5C4SWD4_9BACL|nr:AraC family transcriptional regulator [Paenibacillus hemerocallicola]TNJ59088.1 helix-turn-helix transcriptional regulator [Paenibacillus hemerocallicola]